MTLVEVCFAVFVFALVSVSTLGAWVSAVGTSANIRRLQAAVDCADSTAERVWAGVAPTVSMQENGQVCQVKVNHDEAPKGTVIQVECGGQTATLWVPEL